MKNSEAKNNKSNEFISFQSIEESKSNLEQKLPIENKVKLGELNFDKNIKIKGPKLSLKANISDHNLINLQ